MSPKLIIIAGPNGAGKSTLSNDIVAKYGITAFDFDKEYYAQWAKFSYDPAVQRGCKEFVSKKFDDSIAEAFLSKSHFCFETNYHTQDILKYLDLADQHGFEKNLVFIGLKSEKLAKERVQFRVKEDNGHFVPDEEVEIRFNYGLVLLDQSFTRYENLFILESFPGFMTENCIRIKGEKGYQIKSPSYLVHLPNLKKKIKRLDQSKSIGFNI